MRFFYNSSIKYKWTEQIIEEIWSKFMFIASYDLVTAYYNKTLGKIYSNVVKLSYVGNYMWYYFLGIK